MQGASALADRAGARGIPVLPRTERGADVAPSAYLYADGLRRILRMLDGLNAATANSDDSDRLVLDAFVFDIPVWNAEPAMVDDHEFLGWVHQIDSDQFVFIPSSAVTA